MATEKTKPEDQKTPDEIRDEIKETREELGDTVEALGAKTDVKGRAQAKVEEVKADVKDKLPGGGADGSGPSGAPQQHAQAAADTVKRNPLPFAVVAALLIGYLIGRGRGGR